MKRPKITKRLLGVLRRFGQWRCAEPVVVFESDDWGMPRWASSMAVKRYGKPNEWADEELETEADLSALYRTLGDYGDPSGRPACLVANFVVGWPDFDAIRANGFTQYHDISFAEASPASTLAKWQHGQAQRLFFPQYHARAHYWPLLWLRDLQEDVPGARALFDERCYGGLALIEQKNWRYHSEYVNWESGDILQGMALQSWLGEGIRRFQAVFGFRPQSTIAPHYIFTGETLRGFEQAGITLIQGANYHILRGRDKRQVTISHPLGECPSPGMLYLARNVKFDPRPQRPSHGVVSALLHIEQAFHEHIPAVIDTHRINYTGAWREQSVVALSQMLKALQTRNAYMLTSAELGEAVITNKMFTDCWTGEQRQLTSLDTPIRRTARLLLTYYHSQLISKVGLAPL